MASFSRTTRTSQCLHAKRDHLFVKEERSRKNRVLEMNKRLGILGKKSEIVHM